MAYVSPRPPIRAAARITPRAEAHSVWDLDAVWRVVARQPLTLGPLVWIYLLPDDEAEMFRGGRMLGAIVTVTGRDQTGTPVLYARRGDNLQWWKSREIC